MSSRDGLADEVLAMLHKAYDKTAYTQKTHLGLSVLTILAFHNHSLVFVTQ